MAQLPSDNAELVRQLARGNEAAFHSLYERYQRPIFRFAWHMSSSQTTADPVDKVSYVLDLNDKTAQVIKMPPAEQDGAGPGTV